MQTSKETFKKRPEKSSTVGHIPNTSSLMSDEDSDEFFSSSSSSPNTLFFLKLPAVKTDCWLEKRYLELADFTKRLIQQSGLYCPHATPDSSPSKTIYNNHPNTSSADMAFSSFSPQNRELAKSNEIFKEIHTNSSRYYGKFITLAKTFGVNLELMERSVGNRELFLINNGLDKDIAQSFANKSKGYSSASLVMLLYLVDKYPDIDQETMFNTLRNGNDIYVTFNEIIKQKEQASGLSKSY